MRDFDLRSVSYVRRVLYKNPCVARPRSLDHLVGTREQRRWHLQAERLGGFEVDHQFDLHRLLDWYAIPTMYFLREFATVGGLMSYGSSLTDAYHRIGISTGKNLTRRQTGRPGALDLSGAAEILLGSTPISTVMPWPDHGPLSDSRGAAVPDNAHVRDLRGYLFKKLRPFSAQAVFKLKKSGGVATRPRETCDLARPDRVNALGEHDGHGPARRS